MSSKGFDPEEQGRDGDGCQVGLVGFVVTSGDRAVLLEAIEAAFDDVAAPIELLVEGWWPASAAAAARPVGPLVAAFGDGVADPAFAQVGAYFSGAVALVAQDVVRAGAGPARAAGP